MVGIINLLLMFFEYQKPEYVVPGQRQDIISFVPPPQQGRSSWIWGGGRTIPIESPAFNSFSFYTLVSVTIHIYMIRPLINSLIFQAFKGKNFFPLWQF